MFSRCSLLFVFVLCLFVHSIISKTIYVSVGGVDTAGCGTSSGSACLTIGFALSIASAGDVISLSEGTFKGGFNITLPITLTSTAIPIIDCSAINDSCVTIILPSPFSASPNSNISISNIAFSNFHPLVPDIIPGLDLPRPHAVINVITNWHDVDFSLIDEEDRQIISEVESSSPLFLLSHFQQKYQHQKRPFSSRQVAAYPFDSTSQNAFLNGLTFSNNNGSIISVNNFAVETGVGVIAAFLSPSAKVWLANCVFTQNNMQSIRAEMGSISIEKTKFMAITGGFAATVLSTDVHPWWGGADVSLDGCEITGVSQYNFIPSIFASGLRCSHSLVNEYHGCMPLIIKNSVFSNNLANSQISLIDGAQVSIINTQFTGNYGYSSSGSILNINDGYNSLASAVWFSQVSAIGNQGESYSTLISGNFAPISKIYNSTFVCTDTSPNSTFKIYGRVAFDQVNFSSCNKAFFMTQNSYISISNSSFSGNISLAQITISNSSIYEYGTTNFATLILDNSTFSSNNNSAESFLSLSAPSTVIISGGSFDNGKRVLSCQELDDEKASIIDFVGSKVTISENSGNVRQSSSESCTYSCNSANQDICGVNDSDVISIDPEKHGSGLPEWLQIIIYVSFCLYFILCIVLIIAFMIKTRGITVPFA